MRVMVDSKRRMSVWVCWEKANDPHLIWKTKKRETGWCHHWWSRKGKRLAPFLEWGRPPCLFLWGQNPWMKIRFLQFYISFGNLSWICLLKVVGTFGGGDDYESADANERCAKSQDEERILCENIRGTIPMLRTLIEKGFVISQGDKIYQKLSLLIQSKRENEKKCSIATRWLYKS